MAKIFRLQIAEIVREFAWQLLETPEHEGSKTVVLEGSDVLNTGRELFVGMRAPYKRKFRIFCKL